MEDTYTFHSFQKVGRFSKGWVITEKIDGTNAQIVRTEDGKLLTASRNRWITPEDDNFGFAKWVQQNTEALLSLPVGRHYGEWYGGGIQRGYGLKEKRFALFNVHQFATERPACCEIVPLLGRIEYEEDLSKLGDSLQTYLDELALFGSKINNFSKPEGIMLYHEPSRMYFKKTFESDLDGKGK